MIIIGIVYAIVMTLLIFGFFPVGKMPFTVTGVDFGNIWGRIAGALIIIGFTFIHFCGREWLVPGIVLVLLALILLLIAMLKYIEQG